ncbi:MAG: NADH-quinone oxidoreductase subunit C [Bacteroidales bacterium]|nr:NADH-quinone oxidoreductase subunit C [Bacteroidales bacterium]MDZ4203787.1 NADH-quinone oxidoreductase subunit C [Bacteroidales bacterium]
MENEELIELLQFKFKINIEKVFIQYKNRVLMQIRQEKLMKIATYLYKDQGLRFIIASAMASDDKFEIIYHFSNDKTGLIVNLQVFLPREKPEIESLVPLFVAADWIEREMHELFGIRFLNHPNLVPLLSQGNWEPNAFPYAKNQKPKA